MKRISHHFKLGLLFALTFALTEFAQAQRRGGSSSSSSRSGSRFSAGLMIAMGQGKMGNGVDVLDRTMIYTPVTLFAGLNIYKKLRLGVNYEYNIVGQSDDPASFSNQNISGKGSGTGVRLDYWDGKQAFGITYRLADSLSLDKPTAAGESVTYKSKGGGLQVQYYRQIKKRFGFVLDYTTETYDDSLATGNIKWTRMSLGIVFTNFTSTGR
jgi:outer membrane phospholipase A